jgi:HPt (histidine-containing phosphotransfer) domain-containing protein
LAAFAQEQISVVKSNLHTLKGSAGTVGVMRVAEIAREAEGRLKENDTSTLETELPKLKRAFEEFMQIYEQKLTEWLD